MRKSQILRPFHFFFPHCLIDNRIVMSEPTHPEVAILNAALEFHGLERAVYLDKACAGDSVLRQRVEALLRAHEQAEGFLEAPPAGFDFQRTDLTNVPLTEKPGDK